MQPFVPSQSTLSGNRKHIYRLTEGEGGEETTKDKLEKKRIKCSKLASRLHLKQDFLGQKTPIE